MKKKILLIEEDPDIKYIVTYFLKEEGFIISCHDLTQSVNIKEYGPMCCFWMIGHAGKVVMYSSPAQHRME
ncbi:hypothetical protein ACFJIV_05750 [Mucilaginibacter sp. UC70_90]